MNSHLSAARIMLAALNAEMRDPVDYKRAIETCQALERHLFRAKLEVIDGWPEMPVIKPTTETLLPAPAPESYDAAYGKAYSKVTP